MTLATPVSFNVSRGDPILVFGGPYSNLDATRAMRSEARLHGIEASNVICTGDVCAYCAHPGETVTEIRDWGCHVLMGNCDEQLAAGADDCACGLEEGSACATLAEGWYGYANASLDDGARSWMGGLPKIATFLCGGVRFGVVHGTAYQINRFVFASDIPGLAQADLDCLGVDVIVAGHCGLPFVCEIGRGGHLQAWFNPGVIGMPANDGTSDVWYGLITPHDGGVTLTTHRLAYDAKNAAMALGVGGFAEPYARTLQDGLWPSLDILPKPEREQSGIALPQSSLRVGAKSGRGPTNAHKFAESSGC